MAKIQKQLDTMLFKNRGKSLPSTLGPLKLKKFFIGTSFVRVEGIIFILLHFSSFVLIF